MPGVTAYFPASRKIMSFILSALLCGTLSAALPLPAQAKLPEPFLNSFSPNLIADVAEQVAPSVVNIDVQRKEAVAMPNVMFGDEVFQRFFGFGGGSNGESTPFKPFSRLPNGAQPGLPNSQEQILNGNGSGVVLDKEGHILTNNHVVTGSNQITVTFNDGRKVSAKVVGTDSYTDLAVLKLDSNIPNLTPIVPAGKIDKLRPGEWVLAIGSPLGFDHTVTFGIISALSRRVPDINSNVEFIQTDAAINPGNSGGPLVNLKGEVIGINTAISGHAQNIGFAIPMDIAQKVSGLLITNGNVMRPWIGISMTELNPTLAKSLGLNEQTSGVAVAQVLQNSPAAKAGFRQGDVIQRIDGQTVIDAKTIQSLIQSKPLKTTLNFQVLRNGHLMGLPVIIEQMPNAFPEQ